MLSGTMTSWFRMAVAFILPSTVLTFGSFGQESRAANTTLVAPLYPSAGRFALKDAFGNMALGSSWRGWPVVVAKPPWETNRLFIASRLSRFTASPPNPDRALPDSEQILLSQPFRTGNHYAGDLHFDPDGYLYLPMGDGVDPDHRRPMNPDRHG